MANHRRTVLLIEFASNPSAFRDGVLSLDDDYVAAYVQILQAMTGTHEKLEPIREPIIGLRNLRKAFLQAFNEEGAATATRRRLLVQLFECTVLCFDNIEESFSVLREVLHGDCSLATAQMAYSILKANSNRIGTHLKYDDYAKIVDMMFTGDNAILLSAVECVKIVLATENSCYCNLIDTIWARVLASKSTGIRILCYLAEFFVKYRNRKEGAFLCDNTFWVFLRDSCGSDDPEDRKHACYVINQFVEQMADGVDTCTIFSGQNSSSSGIKDNWHTFLNIMQTLEENQSHLILPALSLLPNITLLHFSWKFVLLKLSLQHDNNLVRYKSINLILRSSELAASVELLGDKYANDFLSLLLASLNDAYLYGESNLNVIIDDLNEFFNKNYVRTFSLINNINWSSVPLYFIVQSLSQALANAGDCLLKTANASGWPTTIETLARNIKRTQSINIRSALQWNIVAIVSQTECYFSGDEFFGTVPAIVDICDLNTFEYLQPIAIKIVSSSNLKFLDKVNSCCALRFLKYMCQVNKNVVNDEPVYGELILLIGQLQNVQTEDEYGHLVARASRVLHTPAKDSLQFKHDGLLLECIASVLAASQNIKFVTDLASTAMVVFKENKHVMQLHAVNVLQIVSGLPIVYTSQPLVETFCDFLQQPGHRNTDIAPTLLGIEKGEFVTRVCSGLSAIRANLVENNIKFPSMLIRNELSYYINNCGPDVLRPVIRIIKHQLMRFLVDNNDLLESGIEIVDQCFREILSMRRNQNYRKYVGDFIEMIFSVGLENGIWNKRILLPTFRRLIEIANDSSFAILLFYKAFLLNKNVFTFSGWTEILIEGILFGSVPKREQRIEMDVLKKIELNYSQLCLQKVPSSAEVRCWCFAYLASRPYSDSVQHLPTLKEELCKRYFALSRQKSRYYADSLHHRQKLRLAQALLLTATVVPDFDDRYLIALAKEDNQPSVRYIFELIVAKTIDQDILLKYIDDVDDANNNFINSLIMILIMKCNWNECTENSDRLVEKLLPWTLGANFSTRTWAQICCAQFKQTMRLSESVAQLVAYLDRSQNNIRKYTEDFRLLYGNGINPSVYLYHIPRLTGMSSDEFISSELFTSTFEWYAPSPYADCVDPFAKLPTPTVSSNQMVGVNVIVENDNLQMKIVPIREMKPDPEILSSFASNMLAGKQKRTDGLIVVAALVSRIPNLGGLARSCEIFGAEKLVISSLKHTESKEFQSLSMTAEKWITVNEVKPNDLYDYLMHMKTKGYQIVGAEQTAQSQLIHQVTFPLKTVLLLGHEKDGIPANLLGLLDIPVEIPQFGVVRSLNVHVTGAIFMWEYARQHLITV